MVAHGTKVGPTHLTAEKRGLVGASRAVGTQSPIESHTNYPASLIRSGYLPLLLLQLLLLLLRLLLRRLRLRLRLPLLQQLYNHC